MSVIDQLTEFYLKHGDTHEEKLSEEDTREYFQTLMDNGNIITVSDGDILAGYVESWRLTFEQFGRIICGEPFSAMHENIVNGQIAYVGDTYIRPEYRNGLVVKLLRDRFFELNRECTHFVGTARRKKSAPVKVFKNKNINSLNKEMIHVW